MSVLAGVRTPAARMHVGALLAVHWPVLVLTAISAALTAFYMSGRPLVLFESGDALSYMRKAWAILHRPGGIDQPFRGPGYPLFLIVTGAATLDTWWGTLAAQLAIAVVMPAVIYAILAPVTRTGGFVTGLLYMSFGTTYKHMNWILSEQVFIFVQYVVLLLAVRYFLGHRSARMLYAIAILSAYNVMVRPSAALYFWIFIGVCLIFRAPPWRRLVGPLAVYVGIMVLWGAYDYYHGGGMFPSNNLPQTQAERYFAEVYYGGGYHVTRDLPPTIAPGDGPASKKLYGAILAYIPQRRVRSGGSRWGVEETMAQRLFERFTSDDALVANMFRKPNFIYFDFVRSAANTAGGQSLLYAVAREHRNVGVSALVRYFARQPRIILTGPLQTYVGRTFLANFYRYNDMAVLHKFFMGTLSRNLVTEDAGPAARELIGTVTFMIDTFPGYTYHDANGYAQIFGSPEKMKDFVRHPMDIRLPDGREVTGMIEGSIYIWSTMYYGERKTDRLMGQAALEVIRHTPAAAFVLFDNVLRVTFMRHYELDYGRPLLSSWPDFVHYLRLATTVTLGYQPGDWPPGLRKFLVRVDHFNTLSNMVLYLQYWLFWRLTKIVFVLSMLAVIVPLLMDTQTAAPTAFLAAIYAYNVAALSVVIGNFDLSRYEDPFIFLPALLTVLGVCVTRRLLRERAAPAPG